MADNSIGSHVPSLPRAPAAPPFQSPILASLAVGQVIAAHDAPQIEADSRCGEEERLARLHNAYPECKGDLTELLLAVCREGKTEDASWLLSQGANPIATENPFQPFNIARRRADAAGQAITVMLLEQIVARRAVAAELLYCASWEGDVELARMLLDKGMSPQTRSPVSGRMVLMGAAIGLSRKTIAIFQLLLEKGADPLAKDSEGKTVFQLLDMANLTKSHQEKYSHLIRFCLLDTLPGFEARDC